MSILSVKEWLAGAGKEACHNARAWLRTLPEDATMDDAWRLCLRADWMFWAGLRSSVAENDPRWRQAAFAIVRRTPVGDGTCWDAMPSAAQRCVEVAEAYERGEATLEERRAAESAAWSAAYRATRRSARSAAESAAESAACRAAWSAAESAACRAARSAAEIAACRAARSAVEIAAWSAQADILRECVPHPWGE